ncbi:hypothetical protein, partial [Cryobacterium levicorallinum]
MARSHRTAVTPTARSRVASDLLIAAIPIALHTAATTVLLTVVTLTVPRRVSVPLTVVTLTVPRRVSV